MIATLVPLSGSGSGWVQEVHHIQLRNAIGAEVDTKRLPFCPKHVCMHGHLLPRRHE